MKFGFRFLTKKTPAIVLSIGYTLSAVTGMAAQYKFGNDPHMQKILFGAAVVGLFITHCFHKPSLNDQASNP